MNSDAPRAKGAPKPLLAAKAFTPNAFCRELHLGPSPTVLNRRAVSRRDDGKCEDKGEAALDFSLIRSKQEPGARVAPAPMPRLKPAATMSFLARVEEMLKLNEAARQAVEDELASMARQRELAAVAPVHVGSDDGGEFLAPQDRDINNADDVGAALVLPPLPSPSALRSPHTGAAKARTPKPHTRGAARAVSLGIASSVAALTLSPEQEAAARARADAQAEWKEVLCSAGLEVAQPKEAAPEPAAQREPAPDDPLSAWLGGFRPELLCVLLRERLGSPVFGHAGTAEVLRLLRRAARPPTAGRVRGGAGRSEPPVVAVTRHARYSRLYWQHAHADCVYVLLGGCVRLEGYDGSVDELSVVIDATGAGRADVRWSWHAPPSASGAANGPASAGAAAPSPAAPFTPGHGRTARHAMFGLEGAAALAPDIVEGDWRIGRIATAHVVQDAMVLSIRARALPRLLCLFCAAELRCALLGRFPLLRDVGARALLAASRLFRLRRALAGEVVALQGDATDNLCLLLKGSVAVMLLTEPPGPSSSHRSDGGGDGGGDGIKCGGSAEDTNDGGSGSVGVGIGVGDSGGGSGSGVLVELGRISADSSAPYFGGNFCGTFGARLGGGADPDIVDAFPASVVALEETWLLALPNDAAGDVVLSVPDWKERFVEASLAMIRLNRQRQERDAERALMRGLRTAEMARADEEEAEAGRRGAHGARLLEVSSQRAPGFSSASLFFVESRPPADIDQLPPISPNGAQYSASPDDDPILRQGRQRGSGVSRSHRTSNRLQRVKRDTVASLRQPGMRGFAVTLDSPGSVTHASSEAPGRPRGGAGAGTG